MKGRVSILVLVTLHGHFHETTPWRTCCSRCLSVHVSHTSGVYTQLFQQYWRQKWPGLLAVMIRHVLLRCISCLKPCDFCLCDIGTNVSPFSVPSNPGIWRWVLFTVAHCQSDVVEDDGTSHMCACVCVCVCVCVGGCVYTLCIRSI